MRLPVLPLIALLPLLAACVAAPPAPVADCGASRYAGLVGQPLSSFDAAQAAGPVRILAPGSAMTMDHNPGRLNIHHDRHRRITRITCG